LILSMSFWIELDSDSVSTSTRSTKLRKSSCIFVVSCLIFCCLTWSASFSEACLRLSTIFYKK
jgi:hypothetical protein